MILTNFAKNEVKIPILNISLNQKSPLTFSHVLTNCKFGWFEHYKPLKLISFSNNYFPNKNKISNFNLNNKQEFGFLRYYSYLINCSINNIQHLLLKPLSYMSISTDRQNLFKIQHNDCRYLSINMDTGRTSTLNNFISKRTNELFEFILTKEVRVK